MANEIAGCCTQILFLGFLPQQACFQLLGYGKEGKLESNERVDERLNDEELAQLNLGVKPTSENESQSESKNNGVEEDQQKPVLTHGNNFDGEEDD